MFKLVYKFYGTKKTENFNDLFDAQTRATELEINLGINRKDIWISRED